MSLSKAERQTNVDFALQIFLSQLKLEWIRTFTINPEDPIYEMIYNTTWGELTDRYSYLERKPGVHNLFTLTPAGWFRALEVTGLLEKGTDFDEQVGKFSAALKARVKGRLEAALVELSTIEKETGIPRGIIANIIDIRYIDYELNRYGCHWAAGFEGRLIVAPTHFGLEVL